MMAHHEFREMTLIESMKSAVVGLKSILANGVSPAMATPLPDGAFAVNTDVIRLITYLLPDKRRGIH